MSAKKVPVRMCVACRQPKEKDDLIRLVKSEDQIVIDETGKRNGRGAYVCAAQACIDKAYQKKILARALGSPVSEALYLALMEKAVQNE